MAIIGLSDDGRRVIITQDHCAESGTFRDIADAMRGRTVIDAILEDDLRDAGGTQSPGKVLTLILE